jgi:hypothetical protein
MDQIDQAQKFEQQRRDTELSDQAAKPAMPFKGKCYNCWEKIEIEKGCFCCVECRDDYEKRHKRGIR